MMLIHKLRSDYKGKLDSKMFDCAIFRIDNPAELITLARRLSKLPEQLRQHVRLPRNPMVMETRVDDVKICHFFAQEPDGEIGFQTILEFPDRQDRVTPLPRMHFRIGEQGEPLLRMVSIEIDENVIPETFGKVQEVQNGQAITAVLMLAAINIPKMTEQTTESFERLNKKRVRNGKIPLKEFHVIRLNQVIKKQLATESSGEGRAFHWRRGHFKSISKGLTWWNPCAVGSKEHGEVVSAYLSEAKNDNN